MATKGASYLYGNTRGSNGKGVPSAHINYQYATAFNKSTLKGHYNDHGSDFGVASARQYEEHAIHFANSVDRKNYESFIDNNGTTYKYSRTSNSLCLIKKNGIIISYYKPKGGRSYYLKEKARKSR